MKATGLLNSMLLLGAMLALSACGGGGSSGGSFEPPRAVSIAAQPQSGTVPAGGQVSVTVQVSQANGNPVADGTVVSSTVSPSNLGQIFGVANGQPGSGSTSPTVGGRAEFVFVSGSQQGSVSVGFSTQPAGQTAASSTTLALTIGPPTAQGNITIQATRTQLPVNLFGVAPFIGSPYMAELTITARSASGQEISIPQGEAGGLGVTINPVTVAAFSTLDDPETEDINEFFVFLGQGPVNMVAGRGTIFVHSFNITGTARITASIQDPDTGRVMTATQDIQVVSTTPPLPSVIALFPSFSGLYVQGSGGQTAGTFEVELSDGIGQPVRDPVSGSSAFNNVRVEIIGSDSIAAGERLTGVNAAGQTVSGPAISIRTNNGIATFSLISGTRVGQTTVRVTADRADNNVDNGISDPVVTERTVVISDGRLFALQITSPALEAIVENRVIAPGEGIGGESQDGSYSLNVSVLATDRQGNPVLPGTPVEFGLIDSPIVGFPGSGSGSFAISGGDGNPQEDGFLFTAPTGQFQTAAGGAGPGDTLLVFGQAVAGNRDLESARTISSISSQTSLSVAQRFNRNDDTGVSVDNGNVLPYIIGRAIHGNIIATAFTDANGVATTRMNFPVSRIGQAVQVWARGSASTTGGTKLITDIGGFVYPGIAPLSIIASPTVIPGNTTASVTVCLRDGQNNPVQGAFINFGFNLPSGFGTIGSRSSGPLPSPTGANGCVQVSVVTTGVSDEEGELQFSLGEAEAIVSIRTAADLILQAFPSAFIGNGTFEVNLRLIDGAGNPVANRAIGFQCAGTGTTAIVSVVQPPGLTNAQGQATAIVSAQEMDQPNGGALWTCEFSLAGGDPSTSVIFRGRDSCAGGPGFSPQPPAGACNQGGNQQPVAFTLNLSNGAGGTGGTVTGSGGLTCAVGPAATQACTQNFPSGTILSLIATPSAGPRPAPAVSGSCALQPGQTSPGNTFNVQVSALSSPLTCNIAFQ
ncbi:MAG: hypothetical protein MEQ07_05560 [Aquimonas sp.]|nr:hypothetical protein [Aquimonas sp.]